MKKGLLFLFGLLGVFAANATTYYWVGGTAATFGAVGTLATTLGGTGNASAYTGMNTAGNTDVFIFDGTDISSTAGLQTGTITVTLPSNATTYYGQIILQNGVTVATTAGGTRTLTIVGGTGTDFLINSGCTFNCATTGSTTTVSILTGATGACSGAFTLGGGSNGNQLLSADAGSMVFSGTSVFTQNGTGNAFGSTGTALTTVFQTGTTMVQIAGANPFGLSSPNSKVDFQAGSTFDYRVNAAPSLSGRTYANLIFNNASLNQSATGTSVFTCDNLTMTAGTINVNLTGGVVIKGNISVASGATLTFTPASASNVTFSGTSTQTISKSGTLTFAANANVVIANTASTVSVNSAQTFSGSMTVNSGATLVAGGVTVTLSGTPAINGSFQINQGGWATGGTWSYGSAGTLIFNNTSGSYGVNADVFWPTTNGPANVTVQGGGGITMNVARTVPSSGTTGTFLLVTGTNAVQGTALTLNGTVQINGGNFQTTPTYGSSSTLIYNNGSTYTTSNEWTGGAAQGVAAGSGIPANVTVQTTNLTLGGGRGVPGNVTVGASGQVNLNATAGDLYIGGNLSNSGTWINNSRAVVFVNTGTSTITASSGTQFFDYLLINKTSGSVQQVTGTNVTINTTAGDVLQMLNAGTLDINGNTLTLNNAGGNIFTSGGARTITSTATNGIVNITAGKTVTSASSGTLSFGSNVTVAISAGVNFGSGVSTINGKLQINTGGSCSTNSPTYGSGSTLIYNTGNYNTSNEWIAGGSVGVGVPSNVTLTLGLSSNTVTLGSSRTVPGTLTLTNGSVVIGSNTLTAGTVTATSGDLTGSVTSNLVITATGSSIKFNTSGTGNYLKDFTLNSGATATLANTLNITSYDGSSSEGSVTVSNGATLTTGGFLVLKSDVNGTARVAANTSGTTYISGDVSVERYIRQNSSKGWRLLASNTTGQSINAAWQEGQANSMSDPNPGFGTKITAGNALGFGGNLTNARAAGFDTLSAGVSLFKYNPSTDGLDVVSNTITTGIATEPGYFIFIRGDRSPGQFGSGAPTTATVLRSKGTLFQGSQTTTTGSQNYALARNPFASRLDLNSITFGSNVTQAVQVWDPKIGGAFGVGGYQTLTKSGANFVVAPGGGSYGIIGSTVNFVESGAAFFIQSVSNTNNSITIPETAKTSASSNATFRPSAGESRIAFSLYANNSGSYDVVDGGLAFFNDDYSNAVDVNDVRKNFNFNENFGVKRDNVDLVVERRKQTNINDTLFFSMGQMRQIGYRLDISAVDIDPVITTATLEDRYTNTATPVDLTVNNTYEFTVDANAASKAADRFRLVFRQSIVVPVSFTSVRAAQSGRNISVEWNVANELNVARYEVERSADGRNFASKGTVIANGAGSYNWMDENIINGYNYYRIKSVDNNGTVKYTQVVKVQVGGKAGISVSPNPIQGNTLNIQFASQEAGKYGIRITNIAGQTVYNRQVMHNGGSASQSFVLPSAPAAGIYQLEIITPGNERHTEKLIISGR